MQYFYGKSGAESLISKFKRLFLLAFVIVVAFLGYQYLIGHIDRGSRHIIISILTIWLFTAYFTLPRLHRILTKLYLPDYFIGRVRTGDGLLGDPINLTFMGSEKSLIKGLEAAEWTRAEDLTPKSALRMIWATVLKRSYTEAPVSSLYLFGRKQDFAYQHEVAGNPSKRHHVRFWKVPDGWKLPGGFEADWLAAGTYDRSVGISLFTLQITHKIDENTDEERDYIIGTLKKVKAIKKMTVVDDYSTGYHHRNGGSDSIKTDGAMPFIYMR